MANEIQPIAEIPEQQIPQEEIITETEVSEPIVAPEPPNKSILKSKDGRLFSFKQLIDNNYTPERIQSGIDKQSLTVVGDITDNDQQFKSSDGRMFTYKDLVGAGYDADRIDNGIANGKLSIVEKKSPSPSSLMPTNGSQAGVSPSTTTIQETAVEVGGPGPEPEPNLVDWLASKKLPYDKQSRQKLAELYKIQGYDFSEAKNKELLDYAKTDYELGGNVKQLNYTNDDQGLTKYAQDNGLQYDGSLQSKKQLLADAKTKVGSTKDIQDLVSYAMTFGNLDVSDFSSPESKQKLTDVLGKEAQSLGIQNFNIQDPKSLADLAEGVRTKTNKIEGLYENMQYIKPVSVPTSITEVVETIGLPSDMQSRAKLAVQKGVVQNEAEYVGNGIQNTKLINALKPQYFKIKFAKNLQDVANTVGVKNFDPSNMGSLNDLSSKINQKVGGIKEQYTIFNKEKSDYEKNGRPMGWDFDTYIKFKYNKNKFSQPNLERGYEYRPTKNGVVKFKISEEEQKKYDTMPYLGAMNPTQQKENAKQMGVPLSTYQGIQLAALKGDYSAFADLPQFQKYLKPSRSVMIKSTEFTDEGKKEINSFISDPGNYLRIQKEKGLVNEAEIKNQADEYNRKFKGAVFAQMLSTLPPGEAESSGFAGISKILNPETAQNFAEYLWNNAWAGATQVAGGLYGVIGEDLPAAVLDIFTDHKTDRSISNFLKNDLRESLTFNLRGYDKVFANDYILSAAGAVANMLPAALVNPSGVPVGFVALGYAGGMDAINSTPEGQKLPEYQKMVFAYSNGIMQGVIAKMGIDKIFGSASNKLAINTTLNTIKKAEANNIVLTPLTFEKLATAELNSIKTKALSLAGHMGTGATFGLAMSANDKLLKKLMNESLGKDVFELPSMKLPTKFNDIFNAKAYGEGWGEMLAEGRQGALMGGITASVPMLFNKKQSELKTKIMQADTPEALNKLREQINDKALGNITLDQRETLNKIIDEYSTYNSKIPLSIINIPTRVRIADNLKRRDGLVDELNELMKKKETEDPAFQEGLSEQINGVQRLIEDINKEISDIYSGKKKEPVIITQETQELVQATDLPTEMTPEVVKVAEDNGIVVNENTTPQDVVNEVKNKIGDSTPIVLESVDSKIKNFESAIADAQRRLKENPEDTQATQDLAQAQIELDQIKRDPVRYFEAQKERTINDLQDQLDAGADPQMLQIEAVAKNFDELIEDAKKYAKENPIGDEAVVEVKLAELPTKTIEAEVVEERPIETKAEPKNQKEIDRLRAEEQAELDSRIPNAEQYRVDGKVDRSKLTNPEDIKAFDEVYAKYDKLISPLLEKAEPTKTEAKPEAGNVGVGGEVVVSAKPKPIDEQSIAASQKWIKDLYSLPESTRIQDKNGNVYDIVNGKIRKLTLDKEGNVIDAEIIHTDRDVHKRGAYSNPDFFNEGYKVLPKQSLKETPKAEVPTTEAKPEVPKQKGEGVGEEVKDTFENREAIEDNLKDLGNNVYYHGSDDISYLNSKEDLNTAENTKNAESKYLNLSPKASVAVSYSIRQQKIGEKSGVAAFKLKGKGYTMKDADIKTLKSNADYEAFYDKKKSEGYDYVKVPQDANDIVVLNNNAIEYIGKKLNRQALEQRTAEAPKTEAKPEAPTAEKPIEEELPFGEVEKVEQKEEKVDKDVKKRALAIEAEDPLTVVLQYFISGGKINPSALRELFGRKAGAEAVFGKKKITGEHRARLNMQDNSAPSIKELAHQLWENQSESFQERFTDQDFRNAIEDAITSHSSPKSMAEEVMRPYLELEAAFERQFAPEEMDMLGDNAAQRLRAEVENMPEDVQAEMLAILEKFQNEDGSIDWAKLDNEYKFGFTPELLNISPKAEQILNETINKVNREAEAAISGIPGESRGFEEKTTEPTAEPTAKPEEVTPTEAKSSLEQAKEAMRAAKEKLDAMRRNIGVMKDPKKEAQALYDYHKSLVGVAKEYIKAGIKTVEDFAKAIGEKVTTELKDAWNEATGKKELAEAKPEVPTVKAQVSAIGKYNEIKDSFFGGMEPNKNRLFFADATNDFKYRGDRRADIVLSTDSANFWLTEGADGYVTIDDFQVEKDKIGTGKGKEALSKLIEYADKNGITLIGEPLAQIERGRGEKGLSQKQLIEFYKRNGFEKISKDALSKNKNAESNYLERKPQALISKQEIQAPTVKAQLTQQKGEGVGEAKPEATIAEAPKTALEQAKEGMRAAKEKLDAIRKNLGIIKDPKKEAQALYDYHKALVGVAKEYVKLGVKTVEDWAKQIGENVDAALTYAWNEATGKVKESEQYEDVPYIKASYEKSRLEFERAGAEGGEPPIATSNPDLYSPNGGKRKAALKRNVMEAEGIPSSLKDKIADNLDYEVSSNLEAEQVAKALVDKLGEQDALLVARGEDMHPSVQSAIYAELINRAAEEEIKAKTKEAKLVAAEKWADRVKEYSKKLTGAGQFASYAGHFYKASPLGFLLRENQLTNERFNEWAKDKNVDEIYDALMQMEGGPEKIGAEVEKLRKEERKADRAKRDKKIDDFFDSMKLKGGTYAVVIPPNVWNKAVDLMKAAVKGGDRVVDAVKQATEYISSQIGENWDKDKFKNDYESALSRVADEGKKERTEEDVIRGYEAKMKELQRRIDEGDFSAEEYKGKRTLSDKEQAAKEEYERVKAQYDEAKKKSPEYQKKKAEQFLNEFQRRAKGIDKEKLKEIVRRSVLKISESGGLQREEFRKIVADVMGFKDLTKDQVTKIEKLTDVINAVGPLEDAMVNNPTKENIEKLRQARKEAAVAEVELINMVHRKADFKNTFASIWKGSLMSLFTLLKNPIQNETFQAGVRLPVAFVKQAVEAGIFGVTKGLRGIGIKVPQYTPTTNLAIAQKYFFLGKKEGAKRGLLKFRTGHQGGDYFGTTSYQSSLSPKQAKIDWKLWKSGEKFMTTKEAIDTWIRKSWPSRQADLILRSLGFGDMPARVAAQWGRGAQIAWQELGLREDAQIQAFIESPKKYAYKVLREGGMDEAKAAAKAEEMQNRIMEEGSRAVMEQENILTQAIAGIKGGEKIRESLPASILATTTFPFLKIYSNVMWTGFKLAFPEVSMAQSAYYAREAYLSNKKGDVKKAKEYIEKSKDAASYAAVGAGFRYIAAPYLQQNNLVRSSMSSDEKRRAMQGERFYGKMNQINLGKMLGGDDFFVDLSYWGPLGATMDMATKENERELQKGLKGEESGSWIAERVEDIQEEGLELLNMLALNNGAQTLNAFTSTDKGTAYGISLMNGLGNVMTGGTYAAISKAMLPYEVDNKADKFFNEALNNQKSRNILLRMYAGMPPSRVSIWGEPIKRDVSATGVIYTLLGFEKGSDDKFGAILFNDYQRTQNDKFFPTPIKDKLEVNGREVELPKEKLSELQTFVGQDRKLLIGSLLYDQTTLQVSEIVFKEDVKNNPRYKNVDAGKYLNTVKQKLADYATKYGIPKFDWTRYSSQDELLAKANPIDKKEIQALFEDKSVFIVKKVPKTYSQMNDEQRANACDLIYDFGLKTGMKKFQELNPEYRTMTPSGLDRKVKAYKENVNEINRRVFNKKIKQADALNEAELQSLTNYVEMPQSQQKVTQDGNVEAAEMPETSPEVILFPMENISMDEGDE